MTGFPAGRLDIRVELAFGATGSPLYWTWTDVTDRLEAQTINIRRGRPDEGSTIQPASVSLELQNNDGHLMPGNPASPYWPNVQRGTPLRISVEGAERGLLLTGNGMATTPDHADFDFGGDLDVRVRVLPELWASGTQYTAAGRVFLGDLQRIVTRWLEPSNRGWMLHLFGSGWPALQWSADGTTSVTQAPGELVAAQHPIWLGATLDVDNGASGNTTTWWRWDQPGDPPADITTWEQVGEWVASGTTSVFASSTAPLAVGGLPGFAGFRGRIYAAQVRNGINGTLVANPVFSAQQAGVTTFTDSTGKPWTLTGAAAISTLRHRFVGTIDELLPAWPYGDHNAASTVPSESVVQITASDLVRRLGQGAKPFRSSLARHITSARWAGSIAAYWPCEDVSGAVRLAGAAADAGPLTLTGKVQAGSDSTLTASGSLPSISANETVTFAGAVPPGGPATQWAVEWFHRVPTMATDPVFTTVMEITSNGTARRWRLATNSTLIRTEVLNADGAVVESNLVAAADTSDEWVLWRLDAEQNGGSIDWALTTITLSTGFGGGISDSFTGTLGAVTGIDTTTTAPTDGMTFGHIIVQDGTLGSGWMAGADTAWVGESAAHRIWRLCAEEGIPAEVVGETSGYSTLWGELAGSEPMGPQGQGTLTALLSEAATVDMGVLATRRSAPGFVYRARRTIEAQAAPVVELDAGQNHITNPLQPRLDDQRLRNDLTVAAKAGSSARLADTASIAVEGLYQEQLDINGVGGVPIQSSILATVDGLQIAVDGQNIQQASWRLTLGTWPGLRYPSVSVDLALAPTLIPAFHDLEIGDRITLAGLPAQHPADTVELLVEGISERLSPTGWTVTLACSPGEPWLVGVLDD